MNQLQAEHAAWVTRKYPDQRPKVPAVGCLEEAGELVHAVLKIEQVQTWGEDARHKLPELRVKLVDAIGDCGIYACSLCNANGWDFEGLWTYANYSFVMGDDVSVLDQAIGLAQAAASVALVPTDDKALVQYLCQLMSVAHCLGLDAGAAVRATWGEVRCR